MKIYLWTLTLHFSSNPDSVLLEKSLTFVDPIDKMPTEYKFKNCAPFSFINQIVLLGLMLSSHMLIPGYHKDNCNI